MMRFGGGGETALHGTLVVGLGSGRDGPGGAAYPPRDNGAETERGGAGGIPVSRQAGSGAA